MEFKDYSIFGDYNFGINDQYLNEHVFAKAKDIKEEDTPVTNEEKNELIDGIKRLCERGLTENLAPTFTTSSDARLDFFFRIMEGTNERDTVEMLKESWKVNDLHSLKLIAQLRDIKRGKGIRVEFHQCLQWLYKNHPKTLYNNLEHFASYGYYKDLLHFLMIIHFNGSIPDYLKSDDNRIASPVSKSAKLKCSKKRGLTYNKMVFSVQNIDKNIGTVTRKEMTASRIKLAKDKFGSDLKYRGFHVKIAQIFADQLLKDVEEMRKKNTKNVSMAGKWVPSLGKHFDKYLLICTTIGIELARKLNKNEIFEKHISVGSYLCRKLLHKEFCVPLRKYLEIPEVQMSAGKWDCVAYNRVPAKCMMINKQFFIMRDEERFNAFLKKGKVAGGTLKPVDVVEAILRLTNMTSEVSKTELEVLENQWKSLVKNIKGGGLLKNSIAICDVSGSMSGTPMHAAMALTLLTMELTDQPWNSKCITFSEAPSIQKVIPESSLLDKITILKNMNWGGSTNLHKAMELILDIAIEDKLTQDQLPKCLLVFTDMQFNSAFYGMDMTNFDAIQKIFTDAGYKSAPPVLFWNLRVTKSTVPVQCNEFGALLLSGYSAQQLSYLTEYEDLSLINPLKLMLDNIEIKRYDKLMVYD